MKKLILTCSVVAIAVGAFAQGAVSGFGLNTGVTVSTGVGKQTEFDAGLYSGALSLQIFFSTTATAGEIAAINAQNGVSTAAAQALLPTDGFQLVSSTITGLTANGESTISGFGTYNLSSAFSPQAVGYYALLFSATTGVDAGWSTVIGSGSGTSGGGNYGLVSPGQPYNIGSGSTYATYLGSPAFNNIDLTPTPEPASMVLAGLGGLSLLALRRKK